jgi:signal transduction histidine kinase
MADKNGVSYRLKEATQIAGAVWVAYLERQVGQWMFHDSYRLTKVRTSTLVDYLGQPSVDAWLCGALGSRSSRSRAVPEGLDIGCERLFAFPIEGSTGVLLVGGEEQNGMAQRVWKLVASTLSKDDAEGPEVSPVVSDTIVPAIQEGVPYDLVALDKMVHPLPNKFRAGSVAGSRRAIPEIQAQWRSPSARGFPWPRQMKCCAEISKSRSLVSRQFSDQEWKQLVTLVARSAASVEVIITFTELSGHLRRLAMLNDFVLTVSSGHNIDQIARRVFALLARAFQTEISSLYLMSTDERMVREYRNDAGKVVVNSAGLVGHPMAELFKGGQLTRLNRTIDVEQLFGSKKAQEMMLVPLRYRGRTNGLLTLEKSRAEEFSVYDTHLITVIAGHLAGLLEYSRLREEAEARARNLGLIHEVVQEVIGLLNKQEVVQITAELLVQYFGYEFAVILLVDEEHRAVVCGAGGSRAPSGAALLSEFSQLTNGAGDGITKHVLLTGESLLVNDVSQSPIYRTIKGWDGSELCVSLKDGDRVIGLMDIESSSKMPSGKTTSWPWSRWPVFCQRDINADQYQRSQLTVRELRQTQQELQTRIEAQLEAERRLIQAEKLAAVGEMAAGIAHELNNPLTTVAGFTELVLEDLHQNAESRPDLELVLREARRARDVVRRLLDFSRRSESERTRVDLNELMGDVLSLTNHLMHTSGIQLEVTLGKNLPWVSVDRNQMKQVFLNLFHNAIQAMPTGGQLFIRTAPRQSEGRKWVTASIKDTGAGIAPEHRERIFEPFFTTKSAQGGTGLGLSITYGIVSDHGGDITVESELGKGTCFTVWLPY